MKTILKNVPHHVQKGRTMLLLFFLFTGCMQYDEGLAPADRQPGGANPAAGDLVETAGAGAVMKRTFTAHLMAGNEVPAADSKGQGEAVFTLNADGTELHYKLIVANLKNVTQSHIHCGEAGVNGPVVVFLFGLMPEGVNVNGVLAEGTITAADIIARGPSAACMGGLATFENLLERIRSGGAYVNVHTLAYPGGEIRGQIN